jgi:hypothetical protein
MIGYRMKLWEDRAFVRRIEKKLGTTPEAVT